ncbi:unnamed protein product [Bathycoccus prasinos]|jgi:hypothetical protein
MIERARESDEVLAKQIEYLASVLSSIEHCREEEEHDEEKEKFETNEEVEVEVEGIGKYHDDENNNESDDWADDNSSYWWREEQKSGGEVRILERRRREVESKVGSNRKEERKHLESLITRICALRMRAESIGRQVA